MKNKFKLASFLVLFVSFFVVANEVKAACVGNTPNGSLEAGEQCDDGNTNFDDYCSNACGFQCVGGNGGNIPDGSLEAGEQCDDGNFDSGDGCNNFCRFDVVAVCGNGVEEGGESCDDGNSISGDGCENDCNITPYECGNDIWEFWIEGCDGGPNCTDSECMCNFPPFTESDGLGGCTTPGGVVCGNGTKEAGEGCDDGNTTNGDGCSSVCQSENSNNDPVCGNKIVETGEQCDDGNSNDLDGCDTDCERCVAPALIGGGGMGGDSEFPLCVEKEKEGDFRVHLKTYDCNGNEESKKIEGSKVKLYERDGDKVEEDKTNSKGEANFRDVETGNYKVKCEVAGYVSMKDRSKTAYESGYEKIKDGERASETCRLIKKECKNQKLAITGGSFWSYLLSLIF